MIRQLVLRSDKRTQNPIYRRKYVPWGSENLRGVDLDALGLTPSVGQCGSGLGEAERASSGAGT